MGISLKKIKLTRNKYTLVDDEDFEYLNQFRWYAFKSSFGSFYAVKYWRNRKTGNNKMMHMSRLLLNILYSKKVADHKNGSTLDNRRCNLRKCSLAENARNYRKPKNNVSGYKGVSRKKGKIANPWTAQININKKRTTIGYFKTKKDAAIAYNKAAKLHYGKFAKLNNI